MADPYDKPGLLPDDDELRHHTGINPDDEQDIDAEAASPEELADREGFYNPGGDGPASSGKPSDKKGLRSSEESPSHSQLYNPAGDKQGGLRGRLQNARGTVGKLAKNKWLVGGAIGAGSGTIILLILLVLLAGSLKIPHLAQNITTYQFARLSRQYARSVTRTSDESLALAASNDTVYSKVKAKYADTKTRASKTFSKLDKYRPAKVMNNLQSNSNLQFTYKQRVFGSPRLVGLTIGDSTKLVPKPGLTRFVPGLNDAMTFKNNVQFTQQFMPDLQVGLRATDAGPIVRGIVAKNIRKELGIGLVAWNLGKYKSLDETKARLQATRDLANKVDEGNPADNAKTSTVNDAEEAAKEAEDKVIANDKLLQEAVDNNGVSPTIKSAIGDALKKSGLQDVVGAVSSTYAIAMPVCIIYDGSLENSGPTIDTQTRQQQAAFYFIESAASQQQNGSAPGDNDSDLAKAVGGTNETVGDVNQSNAIVRSAGGTVDTSSSVSAEAGAGGEFTLLNATPGIPGPVASTINATADHICPALTNIWVGAGVGVASIVAAFFSGGTSKAAEEAAGHATTKVVEHEATNFATRFILKSRVISGRAGKLLYDTGKSVTKITAATVVAKLIVANRAGQLNSGLAQGPDLANNADAGGFIAAGEIERKGMGGRPLTQSETIKTAAEDSSFIAGQNSQLSTYDRYFATSNANSLLSRMAIAVGGNVNGSIPQAIIKLGSAVFKPFASLGNLLKPFSANVKAATSNSNYGNITFGWSEGEEKLIDSNDSYRPLENQDILDASGKEDDISSTYGKCFTDTLGNLLSSGAIKRDSQGNVLEDDSDCSPKMLSVKNPDYGDLVFRWRLAQSYNMALDQLTDMQNVN